LEFRRVLFRSFLAPTLFGRVRRGVANDDVEVGRQLADAGAADRLEVNENEFPLERVADATENAVRLVLRMAVDEQLGREQFLAALLDLVVYVGRAAGIRNRLDRAEVVFASRVSIEAAKLLDVSVTVYF